MLKKIISLLLSAILLSACTIPAFATQEDVQSVDPSLTLEGLWEAYEARDMEQLQVYFDALGVNDEEEQSTIVPRWESKDVDGRMCHQQITVYGFLWYLESMRTVFGIPVSRAGFTLNDVSSLVTGSLKPDKDLGQWLLGFSGHFYDPDTQQNYLFNTFFTARTNAEYYYQQALTNYHNNNRPEAMLQLGWALHFLQDANEPHHAANKVAGPLSRHEEFEIFANQKLLNEFMSQGIYEPDDDPLFYQNYQGCTVGLSLHHAAKTAKAWINSAESTNEAVMRICAAFTLGNAMQHSSGLLYKFAKDTHII